MSCFVKLFDGNKEYSQILMSIERGRLPMGVLGLPFSSKAHVINYLTEKADKKALCLVPDEATARKLTSDINSLGGSAAFFPAKVFVFLDSATKSRQYEMERLSALSKIVFDNADIIVATADAAMQLTIPKNVFKRKTLTMKIGDEVPIDRVVEALISSGYIRADMVEGPGQFATRGGILDFFPPGFTDAVRVEFWGDSIDSISYFDVISQRRNDNLRAVSIAPAAEILFPSDEALADSIEKLAVSLKGKRSEKAKELLLHDADCVRNGIRLGNMDKFLPLAYNEKVCLLDYFKDDLLFVSESSAAKEKLEAAVGLHNEELKHFFEEGVLCKELDSYTFDFPVLVSAYERLGAVYLDNFARGSFDTPVKDLVTVNTRQLPVWDGTFRLLLDDIKPMLQRGYTAIILSGTEKAGEALSEELTDNGVESYFYKTHPQEFKPGVVNIVSGTLSAGADYPGEKILIVSYGKRAEEKRKGKNVGYKISGGFNSLDELVKGDYVVHSVHGIGIFDGIQKIDTGGVVKDYIKINYDKNDVLYVPVTQLDLVSKYIGPYEGGRGVKLNRLGSKDWENTKSRVRKSVKNMAKELLALYAKRVSTPGFAFSRDIDMQNDFERRFEFEETEDQLRCIEEIKSDMEQPYPMDRLLCGDVGFGKTEVALRAAFKCVADGKQCAILVPTTILALQHYQTILKRFEGFPVTAEMLSRFRNAKQQEAIKKGLRRGSIDIVVGTHSIIAKGVEFKDLGLLIIDEEQRFGVEQKEKLKERFPSVDCITISATPIPRTLNMAMSGIRDMSIIEEAPQDRQPVQTYVLEHDMGILAEAMAKELRRGGQVYYVHNRIETIERTAVRIKEFLPDARIEIAHGKMSESVLSDIWRRLIEGEIDILVCTTIIETGVDVPNVNTLIIENADYMGLAQLHQMRGRVGRSSRRASAYFTFVKGKELTDVAYRRLSAIREYTEFGSGFKIAMRDLEIRGAGDILGASQHGHMEAVGYDMYLKLLAQEVNKEKGEAADVIAQECLIDLQVDAHIPEKYISSVPQRLSIYRRIADIKNQEDADDVYDELTDRFGDPPDAVMGLIKISMLRNAAAGLGIYEVGQRGDSLLLFTPETNMEMVSLLANGLKGRIFVSAAKKPYISVRRLKGQGPLEALEEIIQVLTKTEDK